LHWLFKDLRSPLKVYIAPGVGARIQDAKRIVEETGAGIMANAFFMKNSYAHRKAMKQLKEETGTYFGLDNGAYQSWKHKQPLVPPEIILHYARTLECDLVIAQDVIGNIEETRRHHRLWSRWIDEYPLAAVLQGATVSRKALEEDVALYKSLGYKRFAFPCVAGRLTLIHRARQLVPYMHGLGMAKLVTKWISAFDSIDIGLWQLRRSPYEPYRIEDAIKFIQKIQGMV
jgi:hypothetical protein